MERVHVERVEATQYAQPVMKYYNSYDQYKFSALTEHRVSSAADTPGDGGKTVRSIISISDT